MAKIRSEIQLTSKSG